MPTHTPLIIAVILYALGILTGSYLGSLAIEAPEPGPDRVRVSAYEEPTPAAQTATWVEFLYAIGTVESGHDDSAIGDGGDSIGRYQIQHAYWLDAVERSGLGGRYENVRDKDYAEKIMLAYFRRYAPEALGSGDWERLARIHNGGPTGHQRDSTLPYWNKVKAVLR